MYRDNRLDEPLESHEVGRQVHVDELNAGATDTKHVGLEHQNQLAARISFIHDHLDVRQCRGELRLILSPKLLIDPSVSRDSPFLWELLNIIVQGLRQDT